ncbi:LOW QUALITY PROTEIN: hypothetical protein MXB_4473, partial [Myxobolus squamalis]
MSPFQIKESKFSKFSPRPKNSKSIEENNKDVENLCFHLNQAILLGGKQTESYCVYLMNNYEAFRRISEMLYQKNNTLKNKEIKEKDSSDDAESSSDDKSSDEEPKISTNIKAKELMVTKKSEKSKDQQRPVEQELFLLNLRNLNLLFVTSRPIKKKLVRFSSDFDGLNHEELCQWFIFNGFESIGSDLPININSGYAFRTMSDNDWSKKLGISQGIERTKLRSTIEKALNEKKNISENLSNEWVTQWLEDIGLNQYKYEFLRRKINGMMLNSLTFKEVRLLGIYNPLHQCSLKRSIQLFRHQEYHPCFLKSHANINNRRNIAFWTVADVASWLKAIKMPQKIKYVRNNGINGALMLLEPRFNSNTIIDVLKVKSQRNRKKIKNEFEKLLPYPVLQDKDIQFRSNGYMPIFKNSKEEKRFAEVMHFCVYTKMWATIEADDLLICAKNLSIDSKYKVPPALQHCPVHQYNQPTLAKYLILS